MNYIIHNKSVFYGDLFIRSNLSRFKILNFIVKFTVIEYFQ